MIAKSDTPGPVFVEIPIDCLYPFKIVEKETGFSKNPKGIKVTTYIIFLIKNYNFSILFCRN
jgi:acetolactate synthase-like protein